MNSTVHSFLDRHAAGKALAARLQELKLDDDVCLLALPRGGVPVAWEISQSLHAPLDMLFVKKVGAPGHPEYAIGAVSESEVIWRDEAVDELKITSATMADLALAKQNELHLQLEKWRKGKKAIDVKNKTAIVVDDGLATGATMKAALLTLKKRNPKRIIVAVPVASESAARSIRPLCDDFLALKIPERFFAVGQWYQEFNQVSDRQIEHLLTGHPSMELPAKAISIPYDSMEFEGELTIPPAASGLVIFAHGSGSSHRSPRNRKVAAALNKFGLATLLFDLLTPAEALRRSNVFNIELLAERLINATGWAMENNDLKHLQIGYFGASTGAAAALAAAAGSSIVKAVVSRGGRPDLAFDYLPEVSAKVLLIVGGDDRDVIALNESAKRGLRNCELVVVPGAGHLFEEGNTMDEVIKLAIDWFSQTLTLPIDLTAEANR